MSLDYKTFIESSPIPESLKEIAGIKICNDGNVAININAYFGPIDDTDSVSFDDIKNDLPDDLKLVDITESINTSKLTDNIKFYAAVVKEENDTALIPAGTTLFAIAVDDNDVIASSNFPLVITEASKEGGYQLESSKTIQDCTSEITKEIEKCFAQINLINSLKSESNPNIEFNIHAPLVVSDDKKTLSMDLTFKSLRFFDASPLAQDNTYISPASDEYFQMISEKLPQEFALVKMEDGRYPADSPVFAIITNSDVYVNEKCTIDAGTPVQLFTLSGTSCISSNAEILITQTQDKISMQVSPVEKMYQALDKNLAQHMCYDADGNFNSIINKFLENEDCKTVNINYFDGYSYCNTCVYLTDKGEMIAYEEKDEDGYINRHLTPEGMPSIENVFGIAIPMQSEIIANAIKIEVAKTISTNNVLIDGAEPKLITPDIIINKDGLYHGENLLVSFNDKSMKKIFEEIDDVCKTKDLSNPIYKDYIFTSPLVDKDVYKEVNFEIRDGTLIAYNGADENVVVPAGINTIDTGAFKGNSNIKNVIIPDGVVVKEGAFHDCESLETLNIQGETVLDYNAILDCPKVSLFITLDGETIKIENPNSPLEDNRGYSPLNANNDNIDNVGDDDHML